MKSGAKLTHSPPQEKLSSKSLTLLGLKQSSPYFFAFQVPFLFFCDKLFSDTIIGRGNFEQFQVCFLW